MDKSKFLNVINEVCMGTANATLAHTAGHTGYEKHFQDMQAMVQVVSVLVDSSNITRHQEKALMLELESNRFFKILLEGLK